VPMNHRFHIYYGYGKGKTTAALGLTLRAIGAGKKVAFVQFDKGADPGKEHYSERKTLRGIPNLALFPFGLERVMGPQSFRFGSGFWWSSTKSWPQSCVVCWRKKT
jgi:ATP:corrinoid adenosyltransferase